MVSWLQKLIMESWEMRRKVQDWYKQCLTKCKLAPREHNAKEEPRKVTKRLGAEGDNKLNRKVNVKKHVEIKRSKYTAFSYLNIFNSHFKTTS